MVATTPLGRHSHHAAKNPESVGSELVRLCSIERLDRELSKEPPKPRSSGSVGGAASSLRMGDVRVDVCTGIDGNARALVGSSIRFDLGMQGSGERALSSATPSPRQSPIIPGPFRMSSTAWAEITRIPVIT